MTSCSCSSGVRVDGQQLRMNLTLDKSDVEAGEQVTATCEVHNPSNMEFIADIHKKSMVEDEYTRK